jgi:protein TonB
MTVLRPGPAHGPPAEFAVVLLAAPRPHPLPWILAAFAHAIVIGSILLGPLLGPLPLPAPQVDPVRVRLLGPPPPPPPPLPLGAGLVPRAASSRVRPSPSPASPSLLAPVELPAPLRPADAIEAEARETAGSESGHELGVSEGMEGGVPGGVVGGVPGGVPGGVIGGTGTGPAPVGDPDQPPRLIFQPKADYPREAFVARHEGTVVVEALVDESGRVVRARVLESVPPLDAAAVAAVRRWTFEPARHRGRRVAALIHAEVTFRIY